MTQTEKRAFVNILKEAKKENANALFGLASLFRSPAFEDVMTLSGFHTWGLSLTRESVIKLICACAEMNFGEGIEVERIGRQNINFEKGENGPSWGSTKIGVSPKGINCYYKMVTIHAEA